MGVTFRRGQLSHGEGLPKKALVFAITAWWVPSTILETASLGKQPAIVCALSHIYSPSHAKRSVFYSSCLGNPLQQPSQKASQLIEVIRARKMYVFADRDFITFIDLIDAEDNNGHILSYGSLVSNTAGGKNHLARYPGQTHENEVGTLSSGALYSILFISR